MARTTIRVARARELLAQHHSAPRQRRKRPVSSFQAAANARAWLRERGMTTSRSSSQASGGSKDKGKKGKGGGRGAPAAVGFGGDSWSCPNKRCQMPDVWAKHRTCPRCGTGRPGSSRPSTAGDSAAPSPSLGTGSQDSGSPATGGHSGEALGARRRRTGEKADEDKADKAKEVEKELKEAKAMLSRSQAKWGVDHAISKGLQQEVDRLLKEASASTSLLELMRQSELRCSALESDIKRMSEEVRVHEQAISALSARRVEAQRRLVEEQGEYRTLNARHAASSAAAASSAITSPAPELLGTLNALLQGMQGQMDKMTPEFAATYQAAQAVFSTAQASQVAAQQLFQQQQQAQQQEQASAAAAAAAAAMQNLLPPTPPQLQLPPVGGGEPGGSTPHAPMADD